MRTEKIVVGSLQEAVEELKRSYGENAVVLSSRVIRRKKFKYLPFFTDTLLEITVGIPEEEGESEFQKEFEEKIKVFEELERLKSTINEVVQTVRQQGEVEEGGPVDTQQFSLRAQRVIERMVYRGVRKDIARKIVEEACGYDIELGKLDFKEEPHESLMGSLTDNIAIEGEEFIKSPPRNVVLLGPTGVGKTTTLAKICYLLKRAGKSVGVITLDSFRVGAVEQLKAFVSVMEIPFRVADTPDRFVKSMREMEGRDVVLVDTAGRSQHDRLRLNELKLFLESLETHIYLTISANLSELVMYEVIMQFGMFPIRGLIFSKLDETSYPGNIINVAYRTKLPILCFTTGQTVPDDIVIANHDYLAKLILEERHELKSAGDPSEA